MTIKFFKLHKDAVIPSYAHRGDSGMDVSCVYDFTLDPHSHSTISTGIGAVIPDGYEIQVRPRSGLASRYGIVCAFGTVDEQYRGELRVTMYNYSNEPYHFKRGDRIAQLVLSKCDRADVIEEIDSACAGDTERGTDGFGSTGR